eukprot:TRINITY_DN4477_c0_g2_i1.p1 TRINITY_DN4477_c0_g2~~TRINITY_DN4477_c0_g2_i1.p1  ORF type:complete len:192 (+),score=21.06 TRINITY_DN4477_c0_g2_i1:19-594(+)
MERVVGSRVPFFYTMVTHAVGDRLGWVMSLFSLVPVFLIVSLVTLVFSKGLSRPSREMTIYMLLGLLLNELVNHFLKHHVFEEPRPIGTEKTDYGMPSDHAQFMSYLWVFRSHCKSLQLFEIPDLFWDLIFGSVVMLVIFSRYYLEYHSPAQLIVGGVVGLVIGKLWSLCGPYCMRLTKYNTKKKGKGAQE